MGLLDKIKAFIWPPALPRANIQGLPFTIINVPVTDIDQQRSIKRIHRLRQHIRERQDIDTSSALHELQCRVSDLNILGVTVSDKEDE